MQATNIDEVICYLDEILEKSREEKSPLGYFPALYRQVTIEVKNGIDNGIFKDGKRMAELDVIFANRYLQALAEYQQGQVPTSSWRIAFEAGQSRWPIVLQHLLVGMNAHISLDLGIAAARTSPGAELAALKEDFNKINEVLNSLVNDVKRELTKIWPLLGLLDYLAGDVEDKIIEFSLTKSREHAWQVAKTLAPLSIEKQAPEIARIDKRVALLGRVIWKPGLLARLVLAIIRVGERGTVPQKIEILTGAIDRAATQRLKR